MNSGSFEDTLNHGSSPPDAPVQRKALIAASGSNQVRQLMAYQQTANQGWAYRNQNFTSSCYGVTKDNYLSPIVFPLG